VLLLIASQQSELHALIAVLVLGFAIGVFGHIIGSRVLIITGIFLVGGVSAYFAFGFSHVT
jgi:hypothetical protein